MLARGARPMTKRPYSTARWQRLRKAKLARDPVCQYCPPGRLTPATEVDHILPMARGGDALDWDNLKSACRSCHSSKTAFEDGGFGRKPGRARVKGCDAQGVPLDPNHWWNDEKSLKADTPRPYAPRASELVSIRGRNNGR